MTNNGHRRARLTRRTVLALGAAWPMAAVAGGEGGGNIPLIDIPIDNGSSSTAPSGSTGKGMAVERFLKRNIREIKKIHRDNRSGRRPFYLDGFSKWFSDAILDAMLNDRRDTRRIIRAMEGIKGTARRKRFLKREITSAKKKRDAIAKTEAKLVQEERKAYKLRKTSADARRKWKAAKKAASEENARLQRAKAHVEFVERWHRYPDEGTK